MQYRKTPESAVKTRRPSALHPGVRRYARRISAHTREEAQSLGSNDQTNPSEYASRKLGTEFQNAGEDAGHLVVFVSRKACGQARQLQAQRKIHGKVSRTGKPNFPEYSARQPQAYGGGSSKPDTMKNLRQIRQAAGKKSAGQIENTERKARTSARAAERGTRTSLKAAAGTAKDAEQSIRSAQAAEKQAARVSRAAAKGIAAAGKAIAHAVEATAKAFVDAAQAIGAAIASGGWVVLVVALVTLIAGLLLSSFAGIFASGENSGTGISVRDVIQEVDTEFEDKIDAIEDKYPHDEISIHGYHCSWSEVLSVYTAKLNADPDHPQEVATVDESKKEILCDIFWDMHDITHRIETESAPEESESTETDETQSTEETSAKKKTLCIDISHKSPEEMAELYGFNAEQQEVLQELLQDDKKQMWKNVLYGIGRDGERMAAVAVSQIGNAGGEKYWRWYGYSSQVEWCACFVSWCANECGHIENEVIPKYAGCVTGSRWFKNRGQWLGGREEPEIGMLIFFDWDSPDGPSGPQDGQADHTGIVEKIEDGKIYTIEGNMSNQVMRREYPIGYYEILGYGVPSY